MTKAFELVVLLSLVTACDATSGSPATGTSGSGSGAPDPPGTVSVELRTQGNGPDSLNFGMGSVTTATVNGASVVCLLGAATDLGLDDAVNFQACAGSIASVGAVGGLGDITTAPSAGFGKSASATINEGYVVKTAEGNTYRVFVQHDIVDASRSVIGVAIKWAPLGDECAGTLSRCNGACVDTTSDVLNCGGCGKVCPGLDAGAGCQFSSGGGVCTMPVHTR